MCVQILQQDYTYTYYTHAHIGGKKVGTPK